MRLLFSLVLLLFPVVACRTPGSAPRYGALMAETGQRFETLGRAAEAGRFELAGFQLEELEELFEDDLPRASPPRVDGDIDLASVLEAMRNTDIPRLAESLATHDREQVREAYRLAAASCNACHVATGHAFLEISGRPGTDVLGLR